MLLGPWTTPAPEINSNLIKAKNKLLNVTNSINQSMLLNSSKVTDHNLSLQTPTTFPKLNSKVSEPIQGPYIQPKLQPSLTQAKLLHSTKATELIQGHWT